MSVTVGIVANPLDPASWKRHETDDVCGLLARLFPAWPSTARIYDLDGFGDWTRAAAVADAAFLTSRDVTPVDTASVARLAQLRGPLMVTVPPADPITLIIAVVAVGVGALAAFLLAPRVPGVNQQTSSPNNSLAERGNKPRPNARIPDIYGQVRSVFDMLAVPYSIFEDHREIEIAFMCVGRGAYLVEDLRDGDTLISAIAGAGVAVYDPYTVPGNGAPKLQVGTEIDQPVLSVAKLNAVNGQTLRAPNSNFYKGASNVRFVAPDTIEAKGTDVDFTKQFDADDQIAVTGAAFGGTTAYFNAATKSARFYPDYRIEFQDFDPSALYSAGQTLVITNAGFTGVDSTGKTIYVDLSGTFPIQSVTSTTIQLVH